MIGLPGGTTSKRVVSVLLGSLFGSPVPCEPVDPVEKVEEHVYRWKRPPEPQE